MERAERIGFGVAAAGHVLLFAALALGFRYDDPVRLKETPLDVSLVKDVGLEATAPQSSVAPAQSVAPDQGEPEDAPAPAAEPAPQPAPAAPAPEPQPAPAPKPAPQPKPQPAPKQAAPAPTKPAPAKPASTAAKAPPAATKGSGSSREQTAAVRPRGSRLGSDFLKGLTTEPSTSRSQAPRAARIDGAALASIVAAIARQIQPCADRQVDPGPGANAIVTTFNLKLNEDGTLAANPRVVRQAGINDENGRYATRVADLGVAAFKGCTPLKLPAQFYSTPNGGWNNINYQWKLR